MPISRHLPPRPLLQSFNLLDEVPVEVYCPFSMDRNDGAGYFLGLRIGRWLFDWKSRGRWPKEQSFGENAGMIRGEWMMGMMKIGDHGQIVLVKPDGTLVFRERLIARETITLAPHQQTPAGFAAIMRQSPLSAFALPKVNSER